MGEVDSGQLFEKSLICDTIRPKTNITYSFTFKRVLLLLRNSHFEICEQLWFSPVIRRYIQIRIIGHGFVETTFQRFFVIVLIYE